MKKNLLILFVISSIFSTPQVRAENVIPLPIAEKSTFQNTDFATYKTSSENLLYLLLSALNENNYSIEEIQFKTGSVLFKAYTKEFIASIAMKDSSNSFLKILPVDNNYNFSPLLIQKLYRYIEANNNINYINIL